MHDNEIIELKVLIKAIHVNTLKSRNVHCDAISRLLLN